MSILRFCCYFTIAHMVSYTLAGSLALSFSKDIYESKKRLCTFMRDMSNKEESRFVSIAFLPAQIVRGVLMSIVLIPFLDVIYMWQPLRSFVFFFMLMFIYTHLASAAAFMDNIEGLVYFKRKFINIKSFCKFQLEMIIYSTIFSGIMTGIMMFLQR